MVRWLSTYGCDTCDLVELANQADRSHALRGLLLTASEDFEDRLAANLVSEINTIVCLKSVRALKKCGDDYADINKQEAPLLAPC